ncbi:MAG: hypothetical protein M1820_007820 [Bogoriella megaspora]|nr:MAG: hypothetical protein M1820_007820 [Bogoriella megaspora]
MATSVSPDVAAEITTQLGKTELGGDNDATSNQDSTAKARKHGWVEAEKYDYNHYLDDKNVPDDTKAWASKAARYEWSDEFGDVAPALPELEKQLFEDEHIMRQGPEIAGLEYKALVEGPVKVQRVQKFEDAGLHPVILDNVVRLCRYDAPTPIQQYVLPAVFQGYDVVGCAHTGSGKTAAYMVPILSKLMGKAKKLAAPRDRARAEPLVLVVCPTRELALQIFDEGRKLCYRSRLRPCVVYGGAPVRAQREDLERGCDILIATPGRLADFMDKPHVLALNRLKYTVIDEADEMLQDDWEEALRRVMASGETASDDHRFLMFSATFPKNARALAKQYMDKTHMRIRVGRTGSTHKNIHQAFVWADDSKKREALNNLMTSIPPARTLIFVNSRKAADLVDDYLFNLGFPSTSIHSERTQLEREDALRAFKTGSTPILIATGVSARGIDIKNIMHVVNYDLPSMMHGGIEEYIHRIGRTARIGNIGMSTSFYNERNEDIAEDLAKILVETNQEVPDFLADKAPNPGDTIVWDDDTDDEAEEGGVAAEGTNGFGATTDSGMGWNGSADANGAATDNTW